ncbi:MAG: hypothetical protein FJ086_07600 [Deltaproteobacteria bacterium]|nr:hypothetical protein [Deltaproteobacteria bacterium]
MMSSTASLLRRVLAGFLLGWTTSARVVVRHLGRFRGRSPLFGLLGSSAVLAGVCALNGWGDMVGYGLAVSAFTSCGALLVLALHDSAQAAGQPPSN